MSRGRSYTCAADNCLTTDRAEAMFNLSCNVKTIRRDALSSLIRCRECATRVAAANGRRLYEHGCGVHPLPLTLRALQTEDDPIPHGATTYACTVCAFAHLPEHMFNRAIGKVPKRIEAVVPYVLCKRCATTHAAQFGCNPCDPGSDVYRLSYTLEQIEARELARVTDEARQGKT